MLKEQPLGVSNCRINPGHRSSRRSADPKREDAIFSITATCTVTGKPAAGLMSLVSLRYSRICQILWGIKRAEAGLAFLQRAQVRDISINTEMKPKSSRRDS